MKSWQWAMIAIFLGVVIVAVIVLIVVHYDLCLVLIGDNLYCILDIFF